MTKLSGPADRNRPTRTHQEVSKDECPGAVRIAYWIFVVAAVVMLASGFVGVFGLSDGLETASAHVAAFVQGNRLVVGVSNIVAGIVVALFAAQLSHGSQRARWIISAVSAFVMFVNIAAMALGVGGLALLLIPLLLMVGLVMMFRPESNAFVRLHNPRF